MFSYIGMEVQGLYGWLVDRNKELILDLLCKLKQDGNIPWLCGGNFNKILYAFEKSGGHSKVSRKMIHFQ